MSTKPHYFRIGLFVILAMVLIVSAVVIFGAGLLTQDKLRFETYFSESITGLSLGSPLELRGVRMGQVEKIGFVGNEYDLDRDDPKLSQYEFYVRVVFSVARGSLPEFADEQAEVMLRQMIDRGLRLRVMPNILTGQAYLEANYLDPERFGAMEIAWTPKYPYIPSAPGELTTLKDSIDEILQRLQEIDFEGLVETFEQVLTSVDEGITEVDLGQLSQEARTLLDETRQKVAALETEKINAAAQELLASLNAAVNDANIPELSQQARTVLTELERKLIALDVQQISSDVDQLLVSLNRAVADANIPELSEQAHRFISDLRESNEHLQKLLAAPATLADQPNLPEVIARLDTALSRIDKLITAERPEIEIMLTNFREISDNLEELTSVLKERPSTLLFSRPPRESEALK